VQECPLERAPAERRARNARQGTCHNAHTDTAATAKPHLWAAGLEQLDHVAGWILEQDLLPAGPGHDVVAERGARIAQVCDVSVDIVDDEMDSIPAAGAGFRPSGIGRPAELCGPARSSRRLPRVTSANAGDALDKSLNPRCLV
jgi:hypothetical protein